MKYKCKDCEHVFESDQTVFECPQCGGTNIVEDGNFCTRNKKLCKILAAVITVLILLLLIPDCKGTKVDVDDSKKGKIVVSLNGEQVDQYNIIVTRDGSDFSTKQYKDKPVNFNFDVPGEYRLQVKFIGKGKMPELSSYNKGPWIVEPPKQGQKQVGPAIPQISEVKILNTDTKTKTYTVKIITVVKAVPLTDTEFSVDNSTYQSSDIFADLKPGLYTFYVRNVQDQSLINQFQFNLPPPPSNVLSDADLNNLLARIAKGDIKAFRSWRKNVDGAQPVPVSGVEFISDSYELAQDAITSKRVYSVRTQRDGDNKILKIIV
jgi:hypothetical protein